MYLLVNDKTLINLDFYDVIQKGDGCVLLRQGTTTDGYASAMKIIAKSQETVEDIFEMIVDGIENELSIIRCFIPEMTEDVQSVPELLN